MLSLRRVLAVLATLAAVAASVSAGTAGATAGVCELPSTSLPFVGFGDLNPYFLAPGADFEGSTSGWRLSGGAGVTFGNESWNLGSPTDTYSLGLPTTSSAVTTPTFCVTTAAPSFRMLIKNNGNLGYVNGQLAVYLNFEGADGHAQTVKIKALTVKSTAWTLTPPISFIQYLSTPLKTGLANVSFTIKPNDNHGNWQIDDLYVDPFKTT